MPPYPGQSSFRSGPPAKGRVTGEEDAHDLLRIGHIFTSLFRERLDLQIVAATSPAPLNPKQAHLLRLMGRTRGLQGRDVARVLGVSSAAATKNVDKLERLGLVVRGPAPGDRRTWLLTLTDEGQRLVRALDVAELAAFHRALERFRPEERQQLWMLLTRLAIEIRAQIGTDHGDCLRCAAHLADDCPVGARRGGCPYQVLRKPKDSVKRATPAGYN